MKMFAAKSKCYFKGRDHHSLISLPIDQQDSSISVALKAQYVVLVVASNRYGQIYGLFSALPHQLYD